VIEERATPQSSVHDAREDYFTGKITAEEYLRRALLTQVPEHANQTGRHDDSSMTDQFRRIFARLGRKDRSNP
jgi:hypothetical protein